MTAIDVIDLAELAAMAKPIRHELTHTRRNVTRFLWVATNGETKAERIQARTDLRRARTLRDAYKRLLLAIQTVIAPKPDCLDAMCAAIDAEMFTPEHFAAGVWK
ncbi:MAG TPA: ABATE domain-containing protein [Propionibacteriaceae bacterium]